MKIILSIFLTLAALSATASNQVHRIYVVNDLGFYPNEQELRSEVLRLEKKCRKSYGGELDSKSVDYIKTDYDITLGRCIVKNNE